MTTDFEDFSDAGKLYAKYSATVDEMWELFKADVSRFHEALKAEIARLILPLQIEEEISDAYSNWWLAHDDAPDREIKVYIYLARKNPETIVPGRLIVNVHYDGRDEGFRLRVNAIKDQLVLPSHCEIVKESRYFSVAINYENSAPLTACAEPIANILRKVDELNDPESK